VSNVGTATDAVTDALDRIEHSDRWEIWISHIDRDAVLEAAHVVERAIARGADLPLAGKTVAVKDNIDVAGVPTTAGCPAYAYVPDHNAPAVQRLVDAGAVVVGKTNLDQFATGLVGTRSPYGACRNAVNPAYVSGGSSSGSAVAVALDLVDIGLGTDTAGSGRVPAACNGIVGIKPTRGLVSTRGVVPACRSLDCVSVLARTLRQARDAMTVMTWFDQTHPWSRPASRRSASRASVDRVGIPIERQLGDLDAAARQRFDAAVATAEVRGALIVEVDIAPYLDAGRLLYGGAFLAERYSAVGEFIDGHIDEVDAVVAGLVRGARDIPAFEFARDIDRLRALARSWDPVWDLVGTVMLPTMPFVPTIADVTADPVVVNARLGVYTTGCNLLDLSAVAVPAGVRHDGLPFGVSFLAPAFADDVAAGAAARFAGEEIAPFDGRDADVPIAVVGAHLRGEPLNGQLTSRGATLTLETTTAPAYRLYRLHGEPARPGLVRVAAEGGPIAVEVWRLTPEQFAGFVAGVSPPLAIGGVELADGRWVPGFVAQQGALEGALDITRFGGWRAYLSTGS
jgi:allophanate hydrolase